MTDQSIYDLIIFSVKCGATCIVLIALAVLVMRHEAPPSVIEDTGEYDDR